eukprot:GHVQ01020462.1.p1 GENE.GHVQ01020462.1~~GHVQ01020462.1.p1  ORF type:complete len:898 (-),score=145.58 GHVQ01020462.1:766-3459(-)
MKLSLLRYVVKNKQTTPTTFTILSLTSLSSSTSSSILPSICPAVRSTTNRTYITTNTPTTTYCTSSTTSATSSSTTSTSSSISRSSSRSSVLSSPSSSISSMPSSSSLCDPHTSTMSFSQSPSQSSSSSYSSSCCSQQHAVFAAWRMPPLHAETVSSNNQIDSANNTITNASNGHHTPTQQQHEQHQQQQPSGGCVVGSQVDTGLAGIGIVKYRSGLMINNSMTPCNPPTDTNNTLGGYGKVDGKVEFVTESVCGRKVNWYGCGPTVYDTPHMGHARTYVTFDVIRRIMQSYFGYDVNMIMNVTDIDDKIIQRANEQGTDFTALAKKWEQVFWDDMRSLNCLLPDCITRVSEYVDEIITFIQGIIDRGYAYASNGSVYFDIQTFQASAKHIYGRMEPSAVNDQQRVLEGEGSLGSGSVSDKKSPLDFALWKKSKADEPFWDSPWGEGRPGWHIECSAMAASLLPYPLDIHSGGIDLRFPHHTNELAQSEAYYDKPQWVNYFMHTGHLHIHGAKMSKSLKNFITIKDVLTLYNFRHIRLLCLMNRWDSPMSYSSGGETMQQAVDVDRAFVNFFAVMRGLVRDCGSSFTAGSDKQQETQGGGVEEGQRRMMCLTSCKQKWNDSEIKINNKLNYTQQKVREYLSDNFNTPDALVILQHLMSDINSYINATAINDIRIPILHKAALYIFRILKIFGLTNNSEESLRYGVESSSAVDVETALSPLMNVLAEFRNSVRTVSQSLVKDLKGSETQKAAMGILQQCDEVRDTHLPDIGIVLEDKPSGFVWKQFTKEEIASEKARRAEEGRQKKEREDEHKQQLADKAAKKSSEAQINPTEYFKTTRGGEFIEYAEDGIPTVTTDGQPVSKSAKDKMRKILDKHTKAHVAWQATFSKRNDDSNTPQ